METLARVSAGSVLDGRDRAPTVVSASISSLLSEASPLVDARSVLLVSCSFLMNNCVPYHIECEERFDWDYAVWSP